MRLYLVNLADFIKEYPGHDLDILLISSIIKEFNISIPNTLLVFFKPISNGHCFKILSSRELINYIEESFRKKLQTKECPLLISIRPYKEYSPKDYSSINNLEIPFSNPEEMLIWIIKDDVLQQKSVLKTIDNKKTHTNKSNSQNAIMKYFKKYANNFTKLPRSIPVFLIQQMSPLKTNNNFINIYNLPILSKGNDYIGYFESQVLMDGFIKQNLSLSNLADNLKINIYNFIYRLNDFLAGIYRIKLGYDGVNIYLISIYALDISETRLLETMKYYIESKKISLGSALKYLSKINFEYQKKREILNEKKIQLLSKGSSLGQNIISGRVVFEKQDIEDFKGEHKILVKQEVLPEDISEIQQVSGLVSLSGGITSHMSVIARGMGKVFITGVEGNFNTKGILLINNVVINKGDWLTIDEGANQLYFGKGQFQNDSKFPFKEDLYKYANEKRKIKILGNIDHSVELENSSYLNFDGIGLCRSENQILHLKLLNHFRCYLISDDKKIKSDNLKAILDAFLLDFQKIIFFLKGKPIHYRLLDAPINEFLNLTENSIEELKEILNLTHKEITLRVKNLKEENSLLGNRGVRWGILNEDFYKGQIDMVFDSVSQMVLEKSINPEVCILLPMVSFEEEVYYWKSYIDEKNNLLKKHTVLNINVSLGCMIETPRAALIVNRIAPLVSSLSIGSNDITQTILGLSRDDFPTLYSKYTEKEIIKENPFVLIDPIVGDILAKVIKESRRINKSISIYLCGEHGGNVDNLDWIIKNGIDGISCSTRYIEKMVFKAALENNETKDFDLLINNDKNRFINRFSFNLQDDINEALLGKRFELAIDKAYTWAEKISNLYGVKYPNIWKFFKREIVVRYFGKREDKRFAPQWNREVVLEYVIFLHQNYKEKIRYSLFPQDIACQATSAVFTREDTSENWRSEIALIDHNIPMEVFPQQSESKMSFRTVFSEFSITFEAGLGQAINVFWKAIKQNKRVKARWDLQKRKVEFISLDEDERELSKTLNELILSHAESLCYTSLDICQDLGLEWVALEGYYDYLGDKQVFIADIDLPLDVAFYKKTKT